MNKVFNKLVEHRWFTPLSFGASYWLLDTIYLLVVPATKAVTLYNALFPTSIGGWLFRIVMFCVCAGMGLAVERMSKALSKAEKLLFLTDYAVEHTKAFGLFWFDQTGQIIRVNQFAADRLGYTKKELLRMSIFDIDTKATPASWKIAWEQLKNSQNLTIHTTHRCKDGTAYPVVENVQYLKINGAEYDFAFVSDAQTGPIIKTI